MIYALLLETSVIIFIIVYFLLNKKANRETKGKIPSLKNTPPVNERKQLNRRNYHRVKVENIFCKIQFIEFGTNKLKPLINKTVEAYIEDISVGGMKITTSFDLPVQYHIISEITFVMKNQEFSFKSEFIRKEAKLKSKQIHYGIRFLEVSKTDENRLGRMINELEISRKIIS